MSKSLGKLGLTVGAILTGWSLTALGLRDADAELCWEYVDNYNTNAPFACVQQGDGVTPCSWNGFCHLDGDPSDCCTAVPSSSPMTNLAMHTLWHQCFGNVGNFGGNNPPGRGQRWYAFHRQYELDFNIFRDTPPFAFLPHIQSLEWCPNMTLPYGHHGCGLAPGVHPAGCGVGVNRPDGVLCPEWRTHLVLVRAQPPLPGKRRQLSVCVARPVQERGGGSDDSRRLFSRTDAYGGR